MDDKTIIGIAIAVFAIFAIVFYLKEKKRTEKLQQLAASLGFGFDKKSTLDVLKTTHDLGLFAKGRGRSLKNRLYSTGGTIDEMVFGYQYTTGTGKHSSTYNQTVAYFHNDYMALPRFELCPENFLHRIAEKFGYQDIDFDTEPDFSKQYLLRSNDEPAIRKAFNTLVIQWFVQRPKISAESNGHSLIVYQHGKRLSVDEITSFLMEARKLYTLLASRK